MGESPESAFFDGDFHKCLKSPLETPEIALEQVMPEIALEHLMPQNAMVTRMPENAMGTKKTP